MGLGEGGQVLPPGLVLLLEQGQEDLLLGVEVGVDGGAGKGGLLPDLLQGDLPEAHGLVQAGAGLDDLLLAGVGPFRGSFGHGASPSFPAGFRPMVRL